MNLCTMTNNALVIIKSDIAENQSTSWSRGGRTISRYWAFWLTDLLTYYSLTGCTLEGVKSNRFCYFEEKIKLRSGKIISKQDMNSVAQILKTLHNHPGKETALLISLLLVLVHCYISTYGSCKTEKKNYWYLDKSAVSLALHSRGMKKNQDL